MKADRTDVQFDSRGATCRAWLYRPSARAPGSRSRMEGSGDGTGGAIPCIVMAPGMGGTRDAGLEPYARKFSDAGYVVVLFDYRYFGASEGEPRQLFSIRSQLQDWASAIAYARSLKDVDPERVALWGTSFSGGHVIVAAARDGGIAAVSAQCPMADALAASWHFIGYAGFAAFSKMVLYGVADRMRAIVGMSPLHIPLTAPLGELAVMCSHDAARGYSTIAPPDWRNEICARFALTFAQYRPIRFARRVRCPTLMQVCLQDSVAPTGPTFATARRIGPKAELERYDCGHFDVYTGAFFERVSARQLSFFSRVVPVPGGIPTRTEVDPD